jgi:type III secretion system low calcium response chaperone LcrH/SycD
MPQVDVSPETVAQAGRIADLVQRVLDGETTLKSEWNLRPEELETMYAVAYNQYANKKYQEAMQAFSLLLLFDPLEYKYLLGSAGCLQMTGRYEMAAVTYLHASAVDQTAPAPFLHLAECLLKLEDREGTRYSLKRVLELSGDSPAWTACRNQAEAMLENLGKD